MSPSSPDLFPANAPLIPISKSLIVEPMDPFSTLSNEELTDNVIYS